MDFNSVYNKIVEKWRVTGHEHLIKELELCSRGAATGGEGVAMTGKFLKDLKIKNINAYNDVKDLIKEYLILCSEWGTDIR